jgi:hypothetical protein
MSALGQKRTFCNAAETGTIRSPHRRETGVIVALRGRGLRGLKIEDKLILRRRLNRPSPLNQANFFNCTVSAEQPVPAAGGGD